MAPARVGAHDGRRDAARRGAARRRDIAGGCQTPTGKAGHALLPFRRVKWKSKRYNGVATSPRSTVSSPPRSRLSSLFLPRRLCSRISFVKSVLPLSLSIYFCVTLVRISREYSGEMARADHRSGWLEDITDDGPTSDSTSHFKKSSSDNVGQRATR